MTSNGQVWVPVACEMKEDILLNLHRCLTGPPMSKRQWDAVSEAAMWLRGHPEKSYRSSAFIRDYLNIHYPWWSIAINTKILGRNGKLFAGFQNGSPIDLGTRLHQILEDMAQSFLTISIDSVTPPEFPAEVSKASNGMRVRKGKVRAPRPWEQFTVPPGRGRRRNFGR